MAKTPLQRHELNEILAAMCGILKQHDVALFQLTAQVQAARSILTGHDHANYERAIERLLLEAGGVEGPRANSIDAIIAQLRGT
jgi:hypothetical protein